jgi:parallel beta-helix repeat protein
LTENVIGASGRSGIEVASSGVVIDMSGFALIGAPNSLDGISAGAGLQNITIANGTVRSWGRHGVGMQGTLSCRIEGVAAAENGMIGILCGDAMLVSDCTARSNGAHGIHSGSGNTLRGCATAENGRDGLLVYFGSIAEACTATQNLESGIHISNGATARDCTATQNGESGFSMSDSSQLIDCIASFNAGYGVDAGWGVQISRCMAAANAGHGIEFGSYSTVTDNHCRANGSGAAGGAGIFMAAGTIRTHIEGNNCSQNDWGIRIDGTTNLIVGNTCTSNTSNFEIVANNRVGEIVTLPLSGAISGNSGGNSTGADPVSNFAF